MVSGSVKGKDCGVRPQATYADGFGPGQVLGTGKNLPLARVCCSILVQLVLRQLYPTSRKVRVRNSLNNVTSFRKEEIDARN